MNGYPQKDVFGVNARVESLEKTFGPTGINSSINRANELTFKKTNVGSQMKYSINQSDGGIIIQSRMDSRN
jgi:hypothetical protein